MEHSHGQNDHCTCCSSSDYLSVRQSFAEVEFERGIWYAAQCNDAERIQTLLNKGVAATVEDSAGYTALHYAARNGYYEICQMLLENHALVNAQTRCGRATPLHRAASQGHVYIVQLLLRSGANPNLQDADGYTALHKALMARSVSVCKLLLPCTDLTLLSNNNKSVEQLAKDECPEILPFLSIHMNTEQTEEN